MSGSNCIAPIELPYNPSNVLLDINSLTELLTRFSPNATFQDINLFRNAFVHKSYCTRKNENFANGNTACPSNCLPLQEESNERLEFLGDAVINLIIGKYLFERYPDESEGFLTKIRTKLVNGNMLADLAKIACLQRFLMISKQIEENSGRVNKKILEDCFEAFIGAMYLDAIASGKNPIEVAGDWLITLIEENIDFTQLIVQNTNYKDTFLKHFQHTYNYLPKFYELSADTTINGKVYRVAVKDRQGVVLSTGVGGTKKEAENDASLNALKFYGVLQSS